MYIKGKTRGGFYLSGGLFELLTYLQAFVLFNNNITLLSPQKCHSTVILTTHSLRGNTTFDFFYQNWFQLNMSSS